MDNVVTGVHFEQGGETFMEADRAYFEKHPDKDVYVRPIYPDEPSPAPYPVEYIAVFNCGNGVRLRVPSETPSLSASDIAELKKIHRGKLNFSKKRNKKNRKKIRKRGIGFSNET